MKKILLFPFLLSFSLFLNAQLFTDITAGLTGLSNSHAAWGDFDNDSDLDLLMCGQTTSGIPTAKIFRNDSGTFTDINAGLEGVTKGAAVWADYDNDGDLDFVLTGENSLNKTFLYRNDNGVFTEISNNFEYFGDYSFAAWGDYDNDGDLDICFTGGWETRLYINNSDHSFTESGLSFIGMAGSRIAWADYDGDGDLDFLLTGDTGGGMKAYLYKNNNGIFEEILLEITGLSSGSVEWGDYDNDGDFDILIMGFDDYIEQKAFVYRNDGNNVFANIYAGLPPTALGSAAWGDFDNDGDLDIAIAGKLAGCGSFTSAVYENVGNDFFNQVNNANLTAAERSFVCWGDFDNDTDLDLILTGINSGGSSFTTIYRNDGSLPNFAPDTPTNLSFEASGSEVILSWDKANDTQTPQEGLTYNVCVGTQSGLYDICSPMASLNTGYRKVTAFGNTSLNNMMKVNGLTEGSTYFWTVQTIDNTFEGSEFAPEQSFTVVYTGLNQKEEGMFSLLPNPTSGAFKIRNLSDNTENTVIKVYDNTGRKIKELTFTNGKKIIIDAGGWDTGLYFVSIIIDQKETAIRKIMVK